jgi:pantetheine-phosphate adenylyltransferase
MMIMERVAVFPGSFDPITRGHESVIRRALPLFDRIIIAIGKNQEKKCYFPLEQRISWVSQIFKTTPNIEIQVYDGLTVDFCHKTGAKFILRGLRTSADFEFERSIGQMNKAMNPDIETVFLLCSPEYASLSSSIVRDIFRNGGRVDQFIPVGIIIKSE